MNEPPDNKTLDDESVPTDVSAYWSGLTSAALLGTERSSITSIRVGTDQLGTALRAVHHHTQSPEYALLRSAALVTLFRQAGVSSAHVSDPPNAPHDNENKSLQIGIDEVCASSASQLLDLLLSDTLAVADQKETLIELWLQRCAATKRRVPDRQIVGLLQRASRVGTTKGFRAAAAACVGARGAFVAAHNPEWAWALRTEAELTSDQIDGEMSAEILDRADATVRIQMFRAWRRRDPAAARESISERFSKESASDRSLFIEAMRDQLSLDDEPFLERCLDDRARGPRQAAIDSLMHVSGSAWGQRMAARVASIASTRRSLTGRKIELTLPDESAFDDAWVRDGIETKPPKEAKVGPRAFVLNQLAAVAPLNSWEQTVDATPANLMAAARSSNLETELIAGWRRAAVTQGSTLWALALLHAVNASEVAAILPEADLNNYLRDRLKDPRCTDADIAVLVDHTDQRFAPDVAQQLAARLVFVVEPKVGVRDPQLGRIFDELPAAIIDNFLATFDSSHYLHRNIRHLHAARNVREAILKEFP